MANGPEGAVLLEAGMAANVTGQPQPAPRRRRTFFQGQRAGIAPPDSRSLKRRMSLHLSHSISLPFPEFIRSNQPR